MDQFSASNKTASIQKSEVKESAPTLDAATMDRGTASTPKLREEMRDLIKKNAAVSADSVEIVAGETVLDPDTLKKMFLLGKLTQGQLAHEMKKFNDVSADSHIKFGKKDVTQSVDFREVGRASVSNPGGDFKPDQENNSITRTPPKDAKEAKKEASSADNDKLKKELEKKEVQMKDQERLVTNRRLNEFTDSQAEQKKQHAAREAKKREEELESTPKDRLESRIDSDKAGTQRPRLTKNLATELKEELEKARSGPGQASR